MYGASMPADACVAPWPVPRMSTTWTRAPREASSWATAHPMMPAPTTVTLTECDCSWWVVVVGADRTQVNWAPVAGRFIDVAPAQSHLRVLRIKHRCACRVHIGCA